MVPSLLHIVRDRVISDICNVESLRGLPETIGEWLFRAFMADVNIVTPMPSYRHLDRSTVLSERARLVHGLIVFSDAYGPLMFSGSLDLSHRLVAINEFIDCLMPLMTYVTSLDLSHCEFGVDHDLVNHFVHMSCLRRLRLRACAITDDFLRKVTIASRVLKRGLVMLNLLDLSYNPKITDKSFTHLKCLKELDFLLLTGTSVTTTSAKVFGSHVGLTVVDTDVFDNKLPSDAASESCSDGWAKELVERMLPKPSSDKQKVEGVHKSESSPFKFFYQHHKARIHLIKELTATSTELSGHPPLSLIRYPRSKSTGPNLKKECDRPALPESFVLEEETFKGYLVSGTDSNFPKSSGSGCRNLLEALDRSQAD